MAFASRLVRQCRSVGNPIVAGIDPRLDWLPDGFLDRVDNSPRGRADAIRAFGRELIDVLAGRVPIVKFQAAFYEAHGPDGMLALHDNLVHARRAGLLVILDGKRNDIGSTAEGYASAYLSAGAENTNRCDAPWPADALTINAYLGSDGVTPFVRMATAHGNGIFALVRTSNPSAREFQDLLVDGRPLYVHVAARVVEWAAPHRDESGYSLLGAVVGATYPEQIVELRAQMPGVLFLLPGYGVQGGTAVDVAPAFDSDGLGAVINSSRGLCFAYTRPDLKAAHGANWQRAVEQAITEMADDLAANTPAGRLRTPPR